MAVRDFEPEKIRCVEAKSKADIDHIRAVFKEYADWLGFDLCFQGFEDELAELPGGYARPDGCLLIANYGSKIAGCVALRKFADGVCEMKRLYVRPEFRKRGIGRKLATIVIDEAKRIGYKSMRLDTLSIMREALALYDSLGFREIESYRHNPLEGAVFLELDLRQK